MSASNSASKPHNFLRQPSCIYGSKRLFYKYHKPYHFLPCRILRYAAYRKDLHSNMACTTILVGRKASYDGSTMIARNDDSGSGHFTPKKFVVVPPQEHPAVYRSVLSHVEVELPGSPMRMTAMPNAVEGKGIWAAGGVNEAVSA